MRGGEHVYLVLPIGEWCRMNLCHGALVERFDAIWVSSEQPLLMPAASDAITLAREIDIPRQVLYCIGAYRLDVTAAAAVLSALAA